MRSVMHLAGGLLAVVLFASPAAAGATRLDFVGPNGNLHCGTGEVTAGEVGRFGSVVIRQRVDQVTAMVHFRGGVPGQTYQLRLLQISEDQADCHFGEVAAVANRAGDVNLRLVEQVQPSTIGFNVSVNTETVFGAPHWVAEQTVARV